MGMGLVPTSLRRKCEPGVARWIDRAPRMPSNMQMQGFTETLGHPLPEDATEHLEPWPDSLEKRIHARLKLRDFKNFELIGPEARKQGAIHKKYLPLSPTFLLF